MRIITTSTIDLARAEYAFHETTDTSIEDVRERLNAAVFGEGEGTEALGLSLGDGTLSRRITGWDVLNDTARQQIRMALIADMGRKLARALPF